MKKFIVLLVLALGVVAFAPKALAGDFNLTSMCRPSPSEGILRIRNTSSEPQSYTLRLAGSAPSFIGTAPVGDSLQVVSWTSSSNTWILDIAGNSVTKAIGNNAACEAEVTCSTECGLEESVVANGLGGTKTCQATEACIAQSKDKKVDVVKSCEGTFDVSIYGGDTRRTWRVGTDEQWVERYETQTWENVSSDIVVWNHDGEWVAADETYITRTSDQCEVSESTPSRARENTFHKDTRCLAVTPGQPQWAIRQFAVGGVQALFSAMGGSKVDIEITNGLGEYEYKMYGLENTGHVFIPNMAMSQVYRIRVVNDCKTGDWLVDL